MIEQLIQNLRLIRNVNNYSQKYIADKLDMDYSSYSAIERGFREISLKRLFLLAEIYNVTVCEILNYHQVHALSGEISEMQKIKIEMAELQVKYLKCLEKNSELMAKN